MKVSLIARILYPAWLRRLKRFCLGHWDSSLGQMHGPEHWERVRVFAHLLSPKDGIDFMVTDAFAYLHDVERHDNLEDPQHGPRAAALVRRIRRTYLRYLNDSQVALLCKACEQHTAAQSTGEYIIDLCFDADRMDLPRVGIIPDPERMATHLGADMVKGDDYLEFWEKIRLSMAGGRTVSPKL